MVTALNVANNVLERGFSEDIDITPMKLQKLVYSIYCFRIDLKCGNMAR